MAHFVQIPLIFSSLLGEGNYWDLAKSSEFFQNLTTKYLVESFLMCPFVCLGFLTCLLMP